MDADEMGLRLVTLTHRRAGVEILPSPRGIPSFSDVFDFDALKRSELQAVKLKTTGVSLLEEIRNGNGGKKG